MLSSCSNCRTPILSLKAALTGGRCLRCALHLRHFATDQPVAADTSLWSDASQRSRSYAPGVALDYFDEFYWCCDCGAAAVFTAAEQKRAYEVEKRYFLQTRKRCNACHAAHRSRRAGTSSVRAASPGDSAQARSDSQ